ncbi:MAG TPA: UDP-N-acetylmuramoyl-tripeptide--D-alanyl-D-alanine ligase [Chlamydiales bacterium]|nr:UDP-N-acetylmuramoyl-tripeptide--D-alanyl-D-alanine ligase [Chlamydiales bacterium]
MIRSVSEIAEALGVECGTCARVETFQIDSRLVTQGSLFFALKGGRTDGHQFLRQAKENGAVAAVVERGYAGEDFGLILLPVDSVLDALQGLAKRDLEKSKARVIGVTGSVGKTMTKEFVFALLRGNVKVGKSPKSYNTKLTLPLSILNREGNEEWLVLEMGMEEPGDIGRLVAIAPPEIAILTGVAMAHSAFFPGGLSEIAKNKGEIFASPRLQAAIFPEELTFSEALFFAPPEKRVTYSLEKREADYFFSSQSMDEKGVRACELFFPFQERHIRQNLLAAIAVARKLGVEWEVIKKRMGDLTLPKMRFERFEQDGVIYINDAYNANPASMRAAFESVAAIKISGKKIAVLGEMTPLGTFSEECHLEVGRSAIPIFDHLLAMGEEVPPLVESFQESQKPAELFFDHKALAERLKMLVSRGDLVLVKGSRSIALEQIFLFL